MPRNVTFTDETARFATAGQGTTQFKTADGKATFTLHSQNGKTTRITAIAANGQPLKVTIMRQAVADEPGGGSGSGSGGGPVECWCCIDTPGGQFCYRIDCKNLPPQVPDPKNAL